MQRPSIKIGSNQVVGYVHIQSEESSGLEEKSARDGLKENDAYNALRRVTKEVISELEKRRFIFRRKSALIDPTKKVADNIDILFDYSELSHSISRTLKKAELSETVINQVDDIISKEAQKKNKTAEEIKKAVAIYQGQATLGKVINVILHEGRRPLNYIKNQSKNLSYYGVEFKKSRNDNAYQKVIELTAGIAQNADSFADLFGRLDTLSARTRISKRKILVAEAINEAVAIFNADCEKDKINVVINCDKDLSIQGWKQDFIAIFVNLLDNSIFWFNEKECVSRVISFNARRIDGIFQLDYTDSGPGISDELLENSVIFEPEFTTKENGTGLGLAIAGEAASRNDLELTAVHDDNGAHFILRSNRD